MPKLYLGIHETSLRNSNNKCLLENWFEERTVEDLDEDRKDPEDGSFNKKKVTDAHKGIVASVCDNDMEDLTDSLDAYRPHGFYVKPPIKTKQSVLGQIFAAQAMQEIKERKEKERIEELREMRKAKSVIINKDVCPMADVFKAEYVNEQPVTFWSKHSKTPLGVTKGGDVSFRRDVSFSTPIQISMLNSAYSNSGNM